MIQKPPLPTRTLTTARSLRTTGTDAEHTLWYHLRARRLGGFKFRRQHPIPPYVADFHCEELRLVIELDGSQHDEGVDGARTAALERQGLFVLRFWDNQVLLEIDAVLEAILAFAERRRPSTDRSVTSPGLTHA
jgi:very-short-patch-repair endonuclease